MYKDTVVQIPALAAQILYPEIFVAPRDEYMKILLKEILEDHKSSEEFMPTECNPYENVLAYIGNIHITPIDKIWNIKHDKENEKIDSQGSGRKLRGATTSSKASTLDERVNFAKMMFVYRHKNEETP